MKRECLQDQEQGREQDPDRDQDLQVDQLLDQLLDQQLVADWEFPEANTEQDPAREEETLMRELENFVLPGILCDWEIVAAPFFIGKFGFLSR